MDHSNVDLMTAVALLQSGDVVAIPTETVYGLAGSIALPQAVEKIFSLKGRPTYHPLIIHLAEKNMLYDYAIDVPAYVETLLETFCPGPLTFVLKRSEKVSPMVTGGQDTVGIRFPAHPLTQALIQKVGHPLAAPSANKFGRISPTSPAHVFSEFGDAVNILDGGVCEVGIESTIVDATDPNHCAILRQGIITFDAIRTALGETVEVLKEPRRAIRVSGALKKHYAPVKPTFLFHSQSALLALQHQFKSLDVLYYSPQYTTPNAFPLPSTPREYAKVLYHRLRLADASPSDAIAIESPPLTPEWEALHDRLSRATCVNN